MMILAYTLAAVGFFAVLPFVAYWILRAILRGTNDE